MSKYIIIPVKTVTDKLENHEYNMDLESMLVDHPQISLDEKDIEEKASAYAFGEGAEIAEYVAELNIMQGYKQALLDIKKELL